MKRIALDTETELLEPGCRAPRLVCMSLAYPDKFPQLFGRIAAPSIFKSYLDGETLIVGHNIAYDMGVLGMHDESLIPKIFHLYRQGLVRDTGIREALIAIREGRPLESRFPLDELSQRYHGASLDKGKDSWRYRYGELMHTKITEWPVAAVDYALTDAAVTLRVADAQGAIPENPESTLYTVSPDEVLQTRAAWVLHLMALWGFRTDPVRVAELRKNLEEECAEAEKRLLHSGIYKIAGTKKKPEISRDMAVIKTRVTDAFESRGLPVPVTEKGNIQTSEDVLRESMDADLIELAEAGYSYGLLHKFIPQVEQGTRWPVTPSWNPLVNSGRTSCGSKTSPGNWQNPPRKGGVRECVVARNGHVFVGADYSQLELCTLAQVLLDFFGRSEMARAIQAGRDLHLELACSTPLLLGHLSYEEAKALRASEDSFVDEKRNFSKVANFGFPGGLGAESFISYARGYGIHTTSEEAKRLKYAYLDRWPEMRSYFAHIAELAEAGLPVAQVRSGRLRGKPDFCATANTFFQGLAADGCKDMLWQLAWKCYQDTASPLYGSRPVLFLHDEPIIETPEEKAHDAAMTLQKIMISSMQRWTPDIPTKCEVRVMRRWYKKAAAIYDEQGRLIPWEPKVAT